VHALIVAALLVFVSAAKAQESLMVYTTTPEEYMRRLTAPFEKKHGVKVNLWRARSEAISQRVIIEARAGTHVVDVIQSIAPSVEALKREKLLRGDWAATLIYVFVQAYNTSKVRRDELPKTYAELAQPRWKGMLGIESSDHEWFSAVVRGMGEERGVALFRELMANGLTVRTGHPLLTQLVASGEVPLALTVYNYAPEQLKKKGAPIDWFAIEPAVGIPDAIAVAARAPRPAAAALFRDYMLGEEAQRIIADIGYVPTHKGVASPLRQTKVQVLDPAALLDEYDRSLGLFQDVVLGQKGRK
jgi:iron(III) transport system substrate-binding protein